MSIIPGSSKKVDQKGLVISMFIGFKPRNLETKKPKNQETKKPKNKGTKK